MTVAEFDASLAATMYQQLVEMSEEPFVGSGKEDSEINLRWVDRQLWTLHRYLSGWTYDLDQYDTVESREWLAIWEATTSMETWQEYDG